MAPRKPFLLRLDPAVHDALASWAADEFRSVNGHIEFILRDALRRAGRPLRPVTDVTTERHVPRGPAAPEHNDELQTGAPDDDGEPQADGA